MGSLVLPTCGGPTRQPESAGPDHASLIARRLASSKRVWSSSPQALIRAGANGSVDGFSEEGDDSFRGHFRNAAGGEFCSS